MKRQFSIILATVLFMAFNVYGLINPGTFGLPGKVGFPFNMGLSTYAGPCDYEGFTCVKEGELDFEKAINPTLTSHFPPQALAAVFTCGGCAPSDLRLPSIMIEKEAAGINHDLMIPTQTAVYSPAHNGHIVYCFISAIVPQDHVRRLSGLYHNDGCDYILENMIVIPEDPAALIAETTRLAQEYLAIQNVVEPAAPVVMSPALKGMQNELFAAIAVSAPQGLEAFGEALRAVDEKADVILTQPEEREYFRAATYVGLKSGQNWTPEANGGNSGWNHSNSNIPEAMAAQSIDIGKIICEDVSGFTKGGLKGAIVSSVCELVRQLADIIFPPTEPGNI